MKHKARYSIGDVSRICNISKKALRYYDEIGLIPSKRKDFNNYRYYTQDALLAVPVIKYYKQMGFTLDEMRAFIEGNVQNVYAAIQRSFKAKIDELERTQEEIRRQYVSVKDWLALIIEAEMVIDNDIREVSIKYVEDSRLLFLDQDFDNNIEAAIINIEFTNYVETLRNEITGPVILNFPSRTDRMRQESQKVRILQKSLLPCRDEETMRFGGQMMLACYHIGPHETLHESYKKMGNWARNHGYALSEEAFERYVTDYWTTRNSSQFVTEILVAVSRRGAMDGPTSSERVHGSKRR